VTALIGWWLSLGAAFLFGFCLGRCWRRRSADAGAGPRALADQLKEERHRRTDRG